MKNELSCYYKEKHETCDWPLFKLQIDFKNRKQLNKCELGCH